MFTVNKGDYIATWGKISASEIWVIDASGENLHVWGCDDLYKSQPKMSPDATRIAYVASEPAGEFVESSVWVAQVNGTEPKRVSPFYRPGAPEVAEGLRSVVYIDLCGWSADGRQLAYLVRGDLIDDPSWLFVTDIGTGQTSRVGGDQVWWAAWSPQEPEFLVVNVQFETFIVNIRTGQWTKIDSFENRGLFAAWTPDGQWLFAPVVNRAIHPVQEEGILIVDKGDQTSRWVSVEGLGKAVWSPDGKMIAYTSVYPDWKSNQTKNLLAMNSDGEEKRLLIGHEAMNVYSEPFVWSPDSRWIAGFGQPTGNRHADLYLVNVCTGEIEILAEGIMPQDEMVWIP